MQGPDGPLKVLFFIHALDGGGAESQLRHLSRGLVARGHQVHVAFSDGDRTALEEDGVILHQLSASSNYAFRSLWAVCRLVRDIRPDVVQSWTLKYDVMVGLVRVMFRFIWVLRESNNLCGQAETLKSRLRIALARKRAHIVANSEGGARYWRQVTSADVGVIKNGYDFTFLDQLQRADEGSEAVRHADAGLCYLGRLSGHKRVDALINAFLRFSASDDSLRLDIIGDGPERGSLEALAHDAGGRICFHGYLAQSQALSLVSGSSALVLLSDYEGTPNVVLEAQYLKVPVILSRSESHTGFFPAETAIFVSPDDPREVCEAFSRVRAGGPEIDRMVACARQFAEQWSLDRMVGAYESFYKALQHT
jgi:glycosyltransferase involved in cell wall biosynthesis